MSLTAERHPHTTGAARVLADHRAADHRAPGTLPSTLHVLLDIGLADDCARVRATLGSLAAFSTATGVRVRLGTAGGPRCLGRLDAQRLERVAAHLGAYARGVDGAPVLSRSIARTGPTHPRLARLLGARPLAVLVTARAPADPAATARALVRSARAGLPWLVSTAPGVDHSAFGSAVSTTSDGPDTLGLAIVQAWDRHRGVEA